MPPHNVDPSFYADWGDPRQFSIGDMAMGECAGEIVTATQFGFTLAESQAFEAQGPFDSRGRSLRQLDLKRRLLRYPCSYMIDTPAFRALPIDVRRAIYARMWDALSGRDASPKYARLADADRRAIVEILRETVADWPAHFRE